MERPDYEAVFRKQPVQSTADSQKSILQNSFDSVIYGPPSFLMSCSLKQ